MNNTDFSSLIRCLAASSAFVGGAFVLAMPALPTAALHAQAVTPQFEVASVKPNKTGDGRVMVGFQPGGRFVATNVPLRFLMINAYRVQMFQILNAPDWTASERFDINAKAPELPPEELQQAMPLMVRALLAERFGLVAHEETREMPIFALVLAHEDKHLGPKLKPSTLDCQAMAQAARGRGPLGPPPASSGATRGGPAPGGPPQMQCGVRLGGGMISANGWPVSQLVTPLSQMTGRVVVDKTGLTGPYEAELTFTPEPGPGPLGPGGPPAVGPDSAGGASIFTAIQEQLGLKLESQRGPVNVVVIDKVSMPTPD